MEPLKLRFFAVGEYGDQSWRPHYHVVLFGGGQCARVITRNAVGTSRPDPENCCAFCRTISRTWNKGLVQTGEVNDKSLGYVAGYVMKKMTAADDKRLDGRHPEFTRMSRRPGIGFYAMDDVADGLLRIEWQKDVPSGLRHGPHVLPLGPYLKRKLRLKMGMEESAPEETLQQVALEMLPVQLAARNSEKSFSQLVGEKFEQYELNQKALIAIHRKQKI